MTGPLCAASDGPCQRQPKAAPNCPPTSPFLTLSPIITGHISAYAVSPWALEDEVGGRRRRRLPAAVPALLDVDVDGCSLHTGHGMALHALMHFACAVWQRAPAWPCALAP